MSEQDQDRQKVKEAIRTLKGKELSDVWIAYFKKYHVSPQEKLISYIKGPLETFDGQVPAL